MKKLYIIVTLAIIAFGGWWIYSSQSGRPFSNNISGTVEANNTQVVNLKNGDTYNLTASIVKKNIAGNEVKMLAYNGSIPGPIIKVPKGAEVTINFTNNTDVPTTIHSHGVRLDNKFDGVPDVTQNMLTPKIRTVGYEII